MTPPAGTAANSRTGGAGGENGTADDARDPVQRYPPAGHLDPIAVDHASRAGDVGADKRLSIGMPFRRSRPTVSVKVQMVGRYFWSSALSLGYELPRSHGSFLVGSSRPHSLSRVD